MMVSQDLRPLLPSEKYLMVPHVQLEMGLMAEARWLMFHRFTLRGVYNQTDLDRATSSLASTRLNINKLPVVIALRGEDDLSLPKVLFLPHQCTLEQYEKLDIDEYSSQFLYQANLKPYVDTFYDRSH